MASSIVTVQLEFGTVSELAMTAGGWGVEPDARRLRRWTDVAAVLPRDMLTKVRFVGIYRHPVADFVSTESKLAA